MAITLVGTASNNAANGNNVTVTLPGGVAQDDLVYAAYDAGSTDSVDRDLTTVTAGYTELADLFSNDVLEAQLGVYRKVQGSTPDTTVQFTGSGDAGGGTGGAVIVLRGVDTTTPEDATTTTATGINGGTADPPSITTVTNNAWVLAIGACTVNALATVPTNYGNLITDRGVDSATGNIMMATRTIAVAGAENPGTFGNVAGGANDAWCAASVAVRPSLPRAFPFMSNSFMPFIVR